MFNGRSISKRILKLQLVDNKTGEVASPLQCLVRNIFLIIWPIEFIVSMANTGRRIGDRVAGTRLVHYDPASHNVRPQVGKMILSVIISYGLISMIPQLLPTIEFTKTNYSKTSYNEAESKALQQSINDAYGKNLTADIRIYDTVQNSNLKYISAIIYLKKNYLEHDVSYRTIHNMVTHLIYQRYPEETFTGQIQYIFRGRGKFQSRSTSIGTNQQTKYE